MKLLFQPPAMTYFGPETGYPPLFIDNYHFQISQQSIHASPTTCGFGGGATCGFWLKTPTTGGSWLPTTGGSRKQLWAMLLLAAKIDLGSSWAIYTPRQKRTCRHTVVHQSVWIDLLADRAVKSITHGCFRTRVCLEMSPSMAITLRVVQNLP
jgi:hypothetical protein